MLLWVLLDLDERVTDIIWHPLSGISQDPTGVNLATCSVDGIVQLWGGVTAAEHSVAVKMEDEDEAIAGTEKLKIKASSPIAKLEGHQDRCSRLAFHPSGRYLLSSSYDCTWRMWDVHKQMCILQQGYALNLSACM